jgi:hypothetical protein
MPSSQPQFWVYENHHNMYAKGHLATCVQVKKQGGDDLANGQWLGPFSTKAQAVMAGQTTGKPFGWCKFCDR